MKEVMFFLSTPLHQKPQTTSKYFAQVLTKSQPTWIWIAQASGSYWVISIAGQILGGMVIFPQTRYWSGFGQPDSWPSLIYHRAKIYSSSVSLLDWRNLSWQD